MKEKYIKYANLLLFKCLNIKKKQPLLIQAPIENIEFVRILQNIALEYGINDIYLDLYDDELKYNELKYLNVKELKNSNLFNKKIFDKYAKNNAAFLMLVSDNPDNYKDIAPIKISESAKIIRESKPIYRKLQSDNKISWCIAMTSTKKLANKVFNNNPKSYELLWNKIFEVCFIDKENPIKEWDNIIARNNIITNKLNSLNIKTLEYNNKLGTNFSVSFDNTIWCSGNSIINDEEIFVNMPSFEVFTSPNKFTANGRVYASKPLIYNSSIINNFYLEFKDGKVIDYDASEGKEILRTIIEIENGNYLGEVALIDTSSPINKTNLLFYETLYDENASCHLALGEGFIECVKENNKNLNKSKTHVDFMIGTDDLNIIGYTIDNKKIDIMINGKIVI